ncbi:MAG: elongation factor P lysine(34) lysyltransferase [Gammaproteobacteria bacterium]|nr:elongation factor P lysine(34) lysyltransferase [Gammaproteobacteria bacterium]
MRWQPDAALDTLRLRAQVLARVRGFFADRGVLEVDTPLMCQATGTDPHLEALALELAPGDWRFLQTSPEFAMKRLLAAGSGPIYQLCKAFRRDESGQRHNPEFTMLEWYRPGFDDHQLMDEVAALIAVCLPAGDADIPRVCYRDLFRQSLGLDPFAASDDQLLTCARSHTDVAGMVLSRDDMLNLLMALVIEPQLQAPVFVVDFPASQAALAQIGRDAQGSPVARRFELFVAGMELANGYLELTDSAEQARRFTADNSLREAAGLPVRAADARLLAALEHGLPACAGVALGFDRLVMLAAGATHIREVLSFVADNA